MDNNEIRLIKPEEMKALVDHYNHKWLGNLLEGYKYLCKNADGTWTAADNTEGECYVEEFDTEEKARFWLEKETYNKEEVENYFKREAIEEGCKDFLVECTVTMSRAVWCRAKTKKDAERIVERAWSDGYIEVDWDDDPTNDVDVVDTTAHVEKGDNYFCELTDGSVEEVVQR